MMPILAAEESLNGAQRAMLGSGMYPRSATSAIESNWRRLAGTQPQSSLAPTDPDALARLGIAVVRQMKPKDQG